MAQKIVGLDLGTREIKVAVLDGGFRGFSVQRYVSVPVPQESPGNEEERPLLDRLLSALETLIEDDATLFKADAIFTAIPGSLVTTHVVTLPFTDSRRIEQTLPFQLEDQIPFDIEDVVFDYELLHQTDGKSDVLVGVTLKQTIASFLEMLSKAGIDPRVISLSTFAYQNLYAHGILKPLVTEEDNNNTNPSSLDAKEEGIDDSAAKDPAWAEGEGQPETRESASPSSLGSAQQEALAEAVLDVGHMSTDLCILERGRVRHARSFPVAGLGLSVAIAAAEKISLQEAETLKNVAADVVEKGGEQGQRLGAALERGIAPLVRGLRQSFFAFSRRTRKKVKRVYLTGGTARLPSLDRHLSRELGCEVVPLDPFPSSLETSLSDEQKGDPAAGLAMALALRGQGGSRTAKVNLRKGEFAYKGDLSRLKGVVPRLALLGMLVVALLLANVMVRFHALSLEESRVEHQLCELTERVLGTCTTFPDDAISRLRGQRAAASLVPQVSAAEILSEVVRRLAKVDEIELSELDIGGSRVRLQGLAESFDAVAKVVSELRDYDCFTEVSQGQTRQARQSEKIEFNVDAVLAAQCEN